MVFNIIKNAYNLYKQKYSVCEINRWFIFTIPNFSWSIFTFIKISYVVVLSKSNTYVSIFTTYIHPYPKTVQLSSKVGYRGLGNLKIR